MSSQSASISYCVLRNYSQMTSTWIDRCSMLVERTGNIFVAKAKAGGGKIFKCLYKHKFDREMSTKVL